MNRSYTATASTTVTWGTLPPGFRGSLFGDQVAAELPLAGPSQPCGAGGSLEISVLTSHWAGIHGAQSLMRWASMYTRPGSGAILTQHILGTFCIRGRGPRTGLPSTAGNLRKFGHIAFSTRLIDKGHPNRLAAHTLTSLPRGCLLSPRAYDETVYCLADMSQ